MLDICGSCHARRAELTGDFKPGDEFFDDFDLVTVDSSDIFYPDGQIHDEDYEFNAFLGSPMHASGVKCCDCHQPHTMKTILPGNILCMRCHSGGVTNAPVINPVIHSHHQVLGYDAGGKLTNSNLTTYRPKEIKQTGGECVNCHMPQTVYMQRHWRHDHGFTIPDPQLTKDFKIPNACVPWCVRAASHHRQTSEYWAGPELHCAHILAMGLGPGILPHPPPPPHPPPRFPGGNYSGIERGGLSHGTPQFFQSQTRLFETAHRHWR
jgi:hypothetical protein